MKTTLLAAVAAHGFGAAPTFAADMQSNRLQRCFALMTGGKTMRTALLAAAAVLGLGAGSAFAGDGDVPSPDTFFTSLPGVIARAPVQQQVPSTVAQTPATGAPTGTFVTNSRGTGTWLYQYSGSHEGANS